MGLIRDGETEVTGTTVACDGLLLRGAITAEDVDTPSSCLATGVSGLADEPHEDVSSSKCVFQSAGFTVIWGERMVGKGVSGPRHIKASLGSRMVRII